MTVATYQYFEIHKIEVKGRKTSIYNIINKSSGFKLGQIRWYGAWRQYCFFPAKFADTVWSKGCLVGVQDFMSKL